MAIGDSFLDVMRLNQSNQQNRAALRLDQERLSLQQADLDLRLQNEERLQDAEAERVRDNTMNDLYTNGLALNLFDHKSLDLNKAAITEALDDPNHPNHGAVQMWLSKATNNSSLVKMPEGFGVTGFTRLQEGGPYQALGEYQDGRGVFGQGVLTNDGGTEKDSPVTMFQDSEDIANFADTFYKGEMLQHGKLGENYAAVKALQSQIKDTPQYPFFAANLNEVENQANAGNTELSRAILGDVSDPRTDQTALNNALTGGDTSVDLGANVAINPNQEPFTVPTGGRGAYSGPETPAGTRLSSLDSVNILLDGSNRDTLNLDPTQSRELRALVNEYRQARGTFTPDRTAPGQNRGDPSITPTDEERATPSGQARINAAERELNKWPQTRLTEMEAELAKLEETETETSPDTARSQGGRRWQMARNNAVAENTAEINSLTAQIANHKSLFNLEAQKPLNEQITNPELSGAVAELTNNPILDSLRNIDPNDADAMQQIIDITKPITEAPGAAQVFAEATQLAGITDLESARDNLNLRDRQLMFAYLSSFASTDSQRNDAFTKLMNIQVTGIEDMDSEKVIETRETEIQRLETVRQNHARNRLQDISNQIAHNNSKISLANSQRAEREFQYGRTRDEQEDTRDAMGFVDETFNAMDEIIGPGYGVGDTDRKLQLEALGKLLPKVQQQWEAGNAQYRAQYKPLMLNLVSRMGQVAAGTQDGGFWENVLETIPKLRGYATVDASDDQLYSLRIQDTYQHNGQTRVASYYKVDGAGRKQGQTVELRNLSGFSRQAANLIELMLLDGAREDFGI